MRRWVIAAGAALLAGCASASPPPGGPEDPAPPRVVRITPDSNAVNVTDRVASFYFDETINDRGSGAQEVDQYFLVSPSDGSARVTWRRSRIDVRPRDGFRANTAYTVTLLPGLRDLRNNAMKEGAKVTFSSGPTIPTLHITGLVFDWAGERPAPRALLQAVTADSLSYLAYADSAGRFDIGPLPAGSYLVRAVADANNNRGPDRNEATDSLRVVAPHTGALELRMIVRDTLPPRIMSATLADSLTLRVTFDRPLDPGAIPAVGAFRLVGPDSVPVGLAELLTPEQEAAAAKRVADARADSARRADSVAGRRPAVVPPAVAGGGRGAAAPAPPRKPSVPAPPASLALRLRRPLAPGTQYRLSVTEARSLSGRVTGSERTFTTPRAEGPAAARPPADTARPRPVSPAPPVRPR